MATPTTQQRRWEDEDQYWRDESRNRDYASGRDYNSLQGGYRYGFERAGQYRDRDWQNAEPELERGWSTYEHRGESTWEQAKHAVRDAWDRVTGSKPSR